MAEISYTGKQESVLRPDEEVRRVKQERTKNIEGTLKTGLGTALNVGTSLAGAGLASKVLPFLSEYIPTSLAIKGINKISPKLGKMLMQGEKMGLDPKEGLNFIKEKMEPKKQEQVKEHRNIIQQYSPELHQFILNKIKEGRTPTEAGALAMLGEKGTKAFKSIIDKITQQHKTPFQSILESIYGNGQTAQPQQEQPIQQPQQANAQPRGLNPSIQAALEKIMQL